MFTFGHTPSANLYKKVTSFLCTWPSVSFRSYTHSRSHLLVIVQETAHMLQRNVLVIAKLMCQHPVMGREQTQATNAR
jgi:hypothetical protein